VLCCGKFLLCCEIFCVEVWQIHATAPLTSADPPCIAPFGLGIPFHFKCWTGLIDYSIPVLALDISP